MRLISSWSRYLCIFDHWHSLAVCKFTSFIQFFEITNTVLSWSRYFPFCFLLQIIRNKPLFLRKSMLNMIIKSINILLDISTRSRNFLFLSLRSWLFPKMNAWSTAHVGTHAHIHRIIRRPRPWLGMEFPSRTPKWIFTAFKFYFRIVTTQYDTSWYFAGLGDYVL